MAKASLIERSKGDPMVKKTGPVIVHKGEAIITRRANKKFGAGKLNDMVEGGEPDEGLVSAISGKMAKTKPVKAMVSIGVGTDFKGGMSGGPSPDMDWRKEDMKRCGAECDALQNALDTHDDAKAGKKVRKALEVKLKLKKLRLQEHKLKINHGIGTGMDY